MAQKGSQKGISLPINMVVILAIAVLVLVVVAAFFVLQAGGSQQSINDQRAWSEGCALAISRGCNSAEFKEGGLKIPNYDPDGNDQRQRGVSVCLTNPEDDTCDDNTLLTACRRTQGGALTSIDCRARCCAPQQTPTTR